MAMQQISDFGYTEYSHNEAVKALLELRWYCNKLKKGFVHQIKR